MSTNITSYTTFIYALECTLVVLPLVCMVCYVIWKKAQKRKQYEIVKQRIYRRLINPVKSSGEETEKLLKGSRRGDDPFRETIIYSSDDPDEEVFQRAARGNRYRTDIGDISCLVMKCLCKAHSSNMSLLER
jgi:hypothetical protein